MPRECRCAQRGPDRPYGKHRPRRREQPRHRDASRHSESEASHHDTRPYVETADPAPKHPARHGDRDHNGEEEACRGQLIAECDQVGDKVSGKHRLDAVEGEAGK